MWDSERIVGCPHDWCRWVVPQQRDVGHSPAVRECEQRERMTLTCARAGKASLPTGGATGDATPGMAVSITVLLRESDTMPGDMGNPITGGTAIGETGMRNELARQGQASPAPRCRTWRSYSFTLVSDPDLDLVGGQAGAAAAPGKRRGNSPSCSATSGASASSLRRVERLKAAPAHPSGGWLRRSLQESIAASRPGLAIRGGVERLVGLSAVALPNGGVISAAHLLNEIRRHVHQVAGCREEKPTNGGGWNPTAHG